MKFLTYTQGLFTGCSVGMLIADPGWFIGGVALFCVVVDVGSYFWGPK